MATWVWALANSSRSMIADLGVARGRQFRFKRNNYAEASCVISHEDPVAQTLIDAYDASGPPILMAWRDGERRFEGPLALRDEVAADESLMTLTFRSPFWRLLGDDDTRYGRYTDSQIIATSKDQGNIVAELIRLYGGVLAAGSSGTGIFTGATANGRSVGLNIGTIETSKLRDRTYNYANVGRAIVAMTGILDGGDFDERYEDDGVYFDWYASLGSTRPASKFEYGPDTVSNCRSFGRAVLPPLNSVRVLGANGLVATAEDATSIAQRGCFYRQVQATDINEQATLNDKAFGLLRPLPVKTVSFVPELGMESCPKPWDDFWLGDTVPVNARRGALEESVNVRINGIDIAIDDQGFEAASIPDPTTPTQEAELRSQLQVEVV